jgi:hypothetical protein
MDILKQALFVIGINARALRKRAASSMVVVFGIAC